MGKFKDSLKRQVGRDTGKFISNMVFGDKHASPIRVSVQKEKVNLEKDRFENEKELEKQRLRDQHTIERKQLEIQQEHLQKERLNQIRHEIMGKLEALTEFEFPDKQEEMVKVLKKWEIQLRSYSFASNEEEKEFMDQYMVALKYKYQQGMEKLLEFGMTEQELIPYNKVVNSFTRKRLWNKINVPVYIIGVVLFVFILSVILD